MDVDDFVCLPVCGRIEAVKDLRETRSNGFLSLDRRLVVDQQEGVISIEIRILVN
jgi:hypothetical protein